MSAKNACRDRCPCRRRLDLTENTALEQRRGQLAAAAPQASAVNVPSQLTSRGNNTTLDDIEQFESDLWEAADNLRANSKLTSSDYFMPVLGVIFLRHAANRFNAAHSQIVADQASGKMPKRKVLPADYIARRSL